MKDRQWPGREVLGGMDLPPVANNDPAQRMPRAPSRQTHSIDTSPG